MTRRSRRGGVVVPALAVCFGVGIMVGWWLRSGAPMPAESAPLGQSVLDRAGSATDRTETVEPKGLTSGPKGTAAGSDVVATTGEPLIAPVPATSLPSGGAIAELRKHGLRRPIDDADVDAMEGGFAERRDAGGRRPHEAVDILAPRNTPVRAVEDGTIAKLFTSKAGGTTVYQFDRSGRFCYYYAHLERYAPGLHDGQHVSQGEVIGFVGTSGNAPPNTPHLHFAVFELDGERRWWKGRAIDPYLIFRP